MIFSVTAAGTQSDAVIFNDSSDDDSWDAVWESAVSIDEGGWTAELRIPLSQFRFQTGTGQTWGLNIVRYIQRHAEEDWWALTGKKESALASRFGHLTGLDAQGRRHLALLPYVTARGEFTSEASADDPFADAAMAAGGLGLDVKWGVTSSLTLDATINPDFGQVEVDPAVVNLTAFETFFEEKRPFFLEGADIITLFGRNGASGNMGFNRSNPTLFYSRRIGRQPQGRAVGEYVDVPTSTTILGATKLTGKTPRGWSFNVIDAVTSREFADVALGSLQGEQEVEPLTNYLVGRVRRDLGQRAGVGLIATSVNRDLRDPALDSQLASRAVLGGVDGHVFFDSAPRMGRHERVLGQLRGGVGACHPPTPAEFRALLPAAGRDPPGPRPRRAQPRGMEPPGRFQPQRGQLHAQRVGLGGEPRLRGERPRLPDECRSQRRPCGLRLAQARAGSVQSLA